MKLQRVTAILVGILALLAAGEANASPQDLFGFGPRTSAMGATGAASARGYEAVWGNPSLLTNDAERSLHLGTQAAVFRLEANDTVPTDGLAGTLIGASMPLPLGGVLKDRLALGLGFFTPFDLVVRGRILYPETPQFPILADRAQSVAVQAGLGVSLPYGIRIGGGFSALAALTGDVSVAQDASGRLGTVVEDTLVAAYAPVVGAAYELEADAATYRIGATYRGELEGRFSVVINVQDLEPIVVPPLYIAGIAQYDPHQIALEVARESEDLVLTAGATWKHWSAYPGLAEPTVRCPPDNPDCGALVPPAPDYGDTVVPRVGAEWTFHRIERLAMRLRGGYFLEPTPAPEQTGDGNVFDEARSALTLGYGVDTFDPLPNLHVDFFGQFHLLHGRTHDKAEPAVDVSTSGFVVAGGTTVGVAF